MRCPICSKETFFEGNPYRPFCSERCKLIDLDNWFSERYRISAPNESREKTEPTAIAEQGTEGGRG